MEDKLTHIDENGRPRMVNVGEKADTKRIAKMCIRDRRTTDGRASIFLRLLRRLRCRSLYSGGRSGG